MCCFSNRIFSFCPKDLTSVAASILDANIFILAFLGQETARGLHIGSQVGVAHSASGLCLTLSLACPIPASCLHICLPEGSTCVSSHLLSFLIRPHPLYVHMNPGLLIPLLFGVGKDEVSGLWGHIRILGGRLGPDSVISLPPLCPAFHHLVTRMPA